MLHDQRWPDCIQRKGSCEIVRIELAPALLGCLAIIVEKSRRIDHQTKVTHIAGERRSARNTSFVLKVDRWRRAATEGYDMLEHFRGLNGVHRKRCSQATALRVAAAG